MATLEGEIRERVAALTPEKQRQALEYIRRLGQEPPIGPKAALAEPERVTGKSGRDLLRFVGIWTDEEADEISRLIEDERERIDTDAW